MKPPVFNYDDHLALQAKYDALAMAARELVAENFALKEELERRKSNDRLSSRPNNCQCGD